MPERDHCGVEGCDRQLFDPAAAEREPEVLHRCALHEIASYNAEELREWGEDNAADMVGYAKAQLAVEAPASDEEDNDYGPHEVTSPADYHYRRHRLTGEVQWYDDATRTWESVSADRWPYPAPDEEDNSVRA